MKLWDNFDPGNPVLRDVDDDIGAAWLLQTSRFTPYDAPPAAEGPRLDALAPSPEVPSVPLADASVPAAPS